MYLETDFMVIKCSRHELAYLGIRGTLHLHPDTHKAYVYKGTMGDNT